MESIIMAGNLVNLNAALANDRAPLPTASTPQAGGTGGSKLGTVGGR